AFGVERHASYEALQNGAKGLFDAKFRYKKYDAELDEVGEAESRWVESAVYFSNSATIELAFTSEVLPLISELEKRFTQYEIEQVAGLQSRYAIRLYEMLMQWRSNGQTPELSLKTIRDRLGLLENEYKRMCDFKSRVIDVAIDQINEHTDIKASYEQHKEGRSITGFTFTFKPKQKPKAKADEVSRDDKTGDLFNHGLTDAQLNKIAWTKQFELDYNHLISQTDAVNQDKKAWVNKMIELMHTKPQLFDKKPLDSYLN
ncbi:replication initiation protein, partial [Escherichia coli]|nr:replication initiation protein [Escherichia coli]